jgi:hypothetical protein
MRKRSLAGALLVFTLVCAPFSFAQSQGGASPTMLPGKHRGAVTALLRDEAGRIFSAGEDGFVGIWNSRAVEER